jgi:hypothetical protein
MGITAKSSGTVHEPIPAGNYVARCYQMIHIGTVEENVMGSLKMLNKVRIGFELPYETKVFNTDKGLQPCVISEEFTLSLHEKATLRKHLESWRGKKFTDKEAEGFDITNLIGKECMVNIIHTVSKNNGNTYAKIGSIAPIAKGTSCPPQVNTTFVFDYENWDDNKFNSLPDFIKTKIQKSDEYKALFAPETSVKKESVKAAVDEPEEDDLPF